MERLKVRHLFGFVLIGSGAFVGWAATNLTADQTSVHVLFGLAVSAAFVGAIGAALMAKKSGANPASSKYQVVVSQPWKQHEYITPEYTAREQIENITTSSGTSFVQRLQLIRKGSTDVAAEFAVIKLYEESFWGSGSDKQLYARPKKRVDLEDELAVERIRELLTAVDYVLCLGLVSNSEATDLDANGLSHRRATKLQEWLNYASVMRDRGAQVLAVPLGRARTSSKKDSRADRDQRTAVLVGVKLKNDLIALPQALDEINPRVRLEAVRLDDYPGSLRP